MRRSSIDSFRESLLKIKHDVHSEQGDDDDEEQDDGDHQMIIRNGDGEGDDDSISDRRISHQFAQSKSKSKSPLLRTPTSNGFDSSRHKDVEIQQYKAELQRLQESESQIKALSINYAALLKEKEDQMSKLRDENGSLRKNLEVSRNGSYTSTNEANGTLTSKKNSTKAVYEKSSGGKLYRQASQTKTASSELGNGIHLDGLYQNNEKELSRVMEDHKITLKTMQAKYESEIKDLKMEFSKERGKFASMQLKFEEEDRLSRSLQKELLTFKLEKDQHTSEIKAMQNELNGKISEIKRLQMELSRRDTNEGDETSESLKRVITQLEWENSNLKMEKGKLETALKVAANSSSEKSGSKGLEFANKDSSKLNEVNASNILLEKEKMEQTIQKLENDLNRALQEKDKALQELKRLKQHLLDKELEESDKMDEDSRVIEDLKATVSHQRSQLLHLEKSLRQALENEETARKSNVGELQKSKETIHQLEEKLASCIKTVEAKNSELSNLQVALGQYYAESEAKERLERDLVHVREETARLSESVKNANLEVEMQKHKTEEILIKLSQSERMVLDGKNTLRKLEEDNIKLRRALEQSMTRLNRMSMDSDYFVDRRIVIKLLVTYFQRNHSKEVLDLMVRMLGFSEEDKQRIGGAQQGTGKGVVRGVLGFPGRLVGGILGSGGPTDGSVPSGPSDNQSFADLWVDFLLKETQERERRELMETTTSGPNDDDKLIKRPAVTEPPSFMVTQPEQSESAFSTVPLTSSVSPYPDNRSRVSRY